MTVIPVRGNMQGIINDPTNVLIAINIKDNINPVVFVYCGIGSTFPLIMRQACGKGPIGK